MNKVYNAIILIFFPNKMFKAVSINISFIIISKLTKYYLRVGFVLNSVG